MIGVIGALEAEIESLLSAMDDKSSVTLSGIQFTRGKLHGRDVVCAKCGVGKVFAAVCAQTMILKFSPDLIINTGVGGTLTPALHIGDIAVGTEVMQHDMDLTALGFPPAYIMGLDTVNIPCSSGAGQLMAECAGALGANFVMGTIATGDVFVSRQDIKEKLNRDYGAVVCEMEGGSIGHVCCMNSVPFLVIRSVSDEADGTSSEDYGSFMEHAAKLSAACVSEFIKRYKEV